MGGPLQPRRVRNERGSTNLGQELDAEAAGPGQERGGSLEQARDIELVVVREPPKGPALLSRGHTPFPHRQNCRRCPDPWELQYTHTGHSLTLWLGRTNINKLLPPS
jgi:hypothetical protein